MLWRSRLNGIGYGKQEAVGVNAEFQYKYDVDEDASFQLVDTVKSVKSRHSTRLRPWTARAPNLRLPARRIPVSTNANPHVRVKGQQQLNKRSEKLSNARRMPVSTRRRDEKGADREASIKVQADWKVIQQFDLSQLTKLQTNVPDAEDVLWCGTLKYYDEVFDRINTRSEKRLTRYDNREFYYVTTTDDPVVEELATTGVANVFATDVILAHLMAAPRTVFPWDIVVQKVGDTLFFDKRDGEFDLLTVNETSFDLPPEEVDAINQPEKLSIEATMINQNFSQQILKDSGKDMDRPNPFADEGNDAAFMTYRYRKWDLGGNVQLVARCELNGISSKRGEEEFITAYALNEWDSKIARGIEWRMKIDAQVGQVF